MPPRSGRRLAAALLVLLSPGVCLAGGARPIAQSIRERWTYRDGLPHNVVHRLVAGRDGYLWVGTQEGLVRFDGVRFKTFVGSDTPGLAGNEVTALFEDDAGVLWVGTGRGLSRYQDDRFVEVDIGTKGIVTALASDGAGGVYVATQAAGLRHVRRDLTVNGPLEGLVDPHVEALAWVGHQLWLGGAGGLARVDGDRATPLAVDGWTNSPVVSLLAGRDGTLWVGTAGGLLTRAPGATALRPVTAIGTGVAFALAEDAQGALWVGIEGKPLQRLVGGQAEAFPATGGPFDCHALAVAPDGDVWVGTESAGLYRVRWGAASTVATEEGLSADAVWTVLEDRHRTVWVATDEGLDHLRDGEVEHVRRPELSGTTVGALLEDSTGVMWVGTGNGLMRFAGGEVSHFGAADGLGGTLVRALFEDRSGTLWAGTGSGVFRRQGERFVALTTAPELDGDKVNAMVQAADGRVVVATTTGLARVDGDRLVAESGEAAKLHADVTGLLADPDGSVWVGTVGDGLMRLTAGRLTRWTRRHGLYEDTVLAIVDDQAGALWLAGTHGITRVERRDLDDVAAGRRPALTPTLFDSSDGMRERECNGGTTPAASRGHDGRLWFATIHGAVVIDPTRVAPAAPAPPVRVEEVVADGRSYSPSASVRLPAGTRRVDVRYTALSLGRAGRVRFHHRLAGLDDAFFDAAEERVAHFTRLGPGAFRFEAAAADGAGAWGEPATLSLEVAPYPWQTRAFAVGLAVFGLASALALYRARTANLRKRQAELSAKVDEEMRKVKLLRGLLPTCAWCKRIRDEHGHWHKFEAYVSARTDAEFTHGMCQDCFEKLGGDGA